MADEFENGRRRFIKQAGVIGAAPLAGMGGILLAQRAPAVIASDSMRPMAPWGVQFGDVALDRAIVWSRSDKAARMFVEWSRDESFKHAVPLRGPHTGLETSDYTGRVDLTGLPSDSQVWVRVTFEDLDSGKARSEPIVGTLRTPPSGKGRDGRRDVRFVWTGDTAGQGWGIDLDFGGMKCYETMRLQQPDFFIHSGDTIYADGPMVAERSLANGGIWRNAFLDEVPEKLKVAETLQEFRRNYLYNLYDANVRRFNAEVPQIWQWDDHEVTNNWSDAKDLSGDARYTEKRVQTLIARGTRAFLEYAPMRWYDQSEEERVYRHIPYGKDLDVFVIDLRSYRGPNSYNRQEKPGEETAFLGREQIQWLKRKLAQSRATWKVIASDMPIGLLVGDGTDAQNRPRWENGANGDGPVLGREFEIAQVLRFIKHEDVQNVVWVTADVHYTAAHYYDPHKAQFKDFDPFWEFVSGPVNAGSFGPNGLDNTFGPQVMFSKAPPPGQVNLPPSDGLQFFGQVDIDHRSKDMVVSLKDLTGATLYSKRLHARPWKGMRED